MIYLNRLALILTFLFSFAVGSFEVPPLKGPVMDEAGLLSLSARREISLKLKEFQTKYGPQIQLLTLETLDGAPLEEASIQIVDKWKLGSESGDNGVLFLITAKERQMRIEVGQGLEGMLTDLKSGRILDLTTPYFASGQFDLGVSVALNAVMGQLGGDPAQVIPVASKKKMNRNPRGLLYFIFLVIFLLFAGRGRRRKRSWFLYGGNHSGFGGSSSSGGWSGGGGGFSGGGASGRW